MHKLPYKLGQLIGEGTFGRVHIGTRCIDAERDDPFKDWPEQIAIKVEPRWIEHRQLRNEYNVLQQLQGSTGIPRCHFFHANREGTHYLGLELLDTTIDDLFNICDKRFTLKTVVLVVDAMLSRLERVHTAGFVYRDVKPTNFLIRAMPTTRTEQRLQDIYIVDFGLAQRMGDQTRPGKMVGTLRYSSVNAMNGNAQTPSDDIESLAYVMLYLLNGRLPWQGTVARDPDRKLAKILLKKERMHIEQVCYGLPPQLLEFVRHARSRHVQPGELPDYKLLRRLLRQALVATGNVYDGEFDWTPLALRALDPVGAGLRQLALRSEDRSIMCDSIVVSTGTRQMSMLSHPTI
ncbi:Protein kinase domain [Carpediemonas membranifera]|uniref:non-specific serine/threonine protein kinase n=1 Tax=Carpediemonas membranifera TaxID=201153 RepID=A0A8J6B1Z9_9EUKA|nr:Protein kinase domain [Carpediemonas membranifera]|eukprot:KAG9397550.1 Protein kinase domain [Carpediemonas membranifera]